MTKTDEFIAFFISHGIPNAWLTNSVLKNRLDAGEDIPIIKFMPLPGMGGSFFSDASPYGGNGIPIPEHEALYKKCIKEGTQFYWTTDKIK